MTGTPVNADDIVFYGSRVAAGDLSRENAALQLVEATFWRLDLETARQVIDTWQGYLTSSPVPAARPSFLRRAGHRLHLTRHPKETTR